MLKFKRLYSKQGVRVEDQFEWQTVDSKITDVHGHTIFERKDLRFPVHFSQLAIDIAASKYFRKINADEWESSLEQLVERVVDTITLEGLRQGYFDRENAAIFYDELKYVLYAQIASFNSPVYFNCGLFHKYQDKSTGQNFVWNSDTGSVQPTELSYKNPQCSACFIQNVNDDLMGIFELAKREAKIFKHGSGTGSNFSRIRGIQEKLSGGGQSSGLMSFLKFLDQGAAVIKSGGTTRRAAKMVCLDIDHPEAIEFINWKVREEEKVRALVQAGFSSDFNGEAYATVSGQNSNNSVRITDAFMTAKAQQKMWSFTARTDGREMSQMKASEVWRRIAFAAWKVADPGLQFHDTINKWNTCATSGEIRASNPCSEYMFLDDTACNLSSINLKKFGTFKEFKIDELSSVARLMLIAQDILVDFSSYPTQEIAVNSHKFRTLGLGFANLGALLMSEGIAYDSDEARGWAGALTGLIHFQSLVTSQEMAQQLGSFAEFQLNHESVNHVLDQHKKSLQDLVQSFSDIHPKRQEQWRQLYARLQNLSQTLGEEIQCLRNAQVTLLAPTGTIGLFMDCETTGIEPDFSLIKFKKLAGGGYLKIESQSCFEAIQNFDLSEGERSEVLEYLKSNGNVDRAPHLSEEQKKIFDCAVSSSDLQRSISANGHVLMMAACQPFLSGAISKTVNLPHSASVDDVERIYDLAYAKGLKAIAIYRDGSKLSQPLNSKEEKTDLEVFLEGTKLDTPYCSQCGHKTVLSGNCYKCLNCGHSQECS